MTARVAATVFAAAILAGCTHYNTVYNAQRVFDEAERERWVGRDSLAFDGYRDVIRRTADAYRGASSDDRRAESLLLLGRARLRLGEARAARAALEEAVTVAAGPQGRLQAMTYLAAAQTRMGERDAALALVGRALEAGVAGTARADAYLLRGVLRLDDDRTADGWADFERAALASPELRGEVAMERLRQGIARRDRRQAEAGIGAVLATDDAADRLDLVLPLIAAAADVWGPGVAATVLGVADDSAWPRAARGRVRLERARLLRGGGDADAASELAWSVAGGRGDAAADARVWLARWHLSESRDLGEARRAEPILLPASGDQRAGELLDALDALDRYASLGLDEPLGWFAAAEVARDRLGAPVLARGLFMAYADTDPADPWAAKALLAALDSSPDEVDRTWIRGRLEAHRHSPYVLAAFGGTAAGFDELEEELRVRLIGIRGG